MIILIELIYIVAAFLLFLMWSGRVCAWARKIGIQGSEERAKAVAMVWRFSDAAIAITLLAILWLPILNIGVDGPWTVRGGGLAFWIAMAFSVFFGFVYVGGSLFAALTVPMGNQVAYFTDLDRKMNA